MRQKLGAKKHAKCEAITGKKYTYCTTRGGGTHFVASCQIDDLNSDWVNWETGEWGPSTRDGKFEPVQRVCSERGDNRG